MKQFRMDNTEGYTEEQLEQLNEIFERETEGREFNEDNIEEKSELDHIREKILREFDAKEAYIKKHIEIYGDSPEVRKMASDRYDFKQLPDKEQKEIIEREKNEYLDSLGIEN